MTNPSEMEEINMNVIKKIAVIIFILLAITLIVIPKTFADDSNFDFSAFDDNNVEGTNGVKTLVNNSAATAITVARIVCVTISIVVLLVIAMKYMMSAPGDRADIKKYAVHYVIGTVILFGALAILTAISEIAELIK